MEPFLLQIVTPDGVSFSGQAERLIVRTIDGDVCILANHTRYVTAVSSGTARVLVDGQERLGACSGGMLAVTRDDKGSAARLVATTFEWADEIDVTRAEKARERAEAMLKKAKDKHEQSVAQARMARALARLQAAGKE